jgi:hypothetical protein
MVFVLAILCWLFGVVVWLALARGKVDELDAFEQQAELDWSRQQAQAETASVHGDNAVAM